MSDQQGRWGVSSAINNPASSFADLSVRAAFFPLSRSGTKQTDMGPHEIKRKTPFARLPPILQHMQEGYFPQDRGPQVLLDWEKPWIELGDKWL